MYNKKKGGDRGKSKAQMGSKDDEMDIRKIMKDIEFLGSSHMTWKERKELENRKVVSLGGKPPKKQRLPLSVARVVMKKQKEREQKELQESLILGRFGGKHGSNNAKSTMMRRRPEDRVLRATEGHFRNGVLDVKHMLRPGASRDTGPSRNFDTGNIFGDKGKPNKGSGKKSGGKKKGGGKKRH